MTAWIFRRDPAYTGPSGNPSPDSSILLRHPIVITPARWGRNVDLLSISYASRPGLRTRLTLRGLTFLRKPWTFGDTSSHRVYRYLCRQGLFRGVEQSSRSAFRLHRMLPYQIVSCRSKARIPKLRSQA